MAVRLDSRLSALWTRAAIPVCKGTSHDFPLSASGVQMRRYIMSFLILVPLGTTAAWADFVVAGSQPPASPPQNDVSRAGDGAAGGTADIADLQFKVAQGFGDRIPLGFAVRQIVPAAVKVRYGPGVSRDALVDWKGGEGWNRVLSRAVHPLGLRLVMTHMAVEIRK
jgi:hypothetical protein